MYFIKPFVHQQLSKIVIQIPSLKNPNRNQCRYGSTVGRKTPIERQGPRRNLERNQVLLSLSQNLFLSRWMCLPLEKDNCWKSVEESQQQQMLRICWHAHWNPSHLPSVFSQRTMQLKTTRQTNQIINIRLLFITFIYPSFYSFYHANHKEMPWAAGNRFLLQTD